jgi:hypothetical protein
MQPVHYLIKNIPAEALDCWARESLKREKVMREASSRGLDTCEYRCATPAAHTRQPIGLEIAPGSIQ